MTKDIREEVLHELDLILNEDTFGFFSVSISKRFVGEKEEIFPTFTMIDNGQLSNEERLKIAHALFELAKRIRSTVIIYENQKSTK